MAKFKLVRRLWGRQKFPVLFVGVVVVVVVSCGRDLGVAVVRGSAIEPGFNFLLLLPPPHQDRSELGHFVSSGLRCRGYPQGLQIAGRVPRLHLRGPTNEVGYFI